MAAAQQSADIQVRGHLLAWALRELDRTVRTAGRALVAFDNALVRLAAAGRDPSAWEEANLLDALEAMSSADYKSALEKIKAALSLPTPADISTITSRNLLNRAQLRDRFDEVVAGTMGSF
ncbi:MAG TPA: hypothetical protein VK641_02465 [Terriglobales bacterium]|nr:hypothetical protein [Terriglobales bacterium]